MVSALPAASGTVALLRELLEPSVLRSAKKHAQLLQAMPKDVDASHLQSVLEAELSAIAERAHARLHRRVDKNTVAAIAVVTLLVSFLSWGLWSWNAAVLPLIGWSLTRVLAVLLAWCGAVLVLVGGGSTLFTTVPSDGDSTGVSVPTGPCESSEFEPAAGSVDVGTSATATPPAGPMRRTGSRRRQHATKSQHSGSAGNLPES